VPDASDRCPGNAGAKPSGCPDQDGDGVVDVDDRCPKVPGIKPGGCPPDKDGDGVPDASDKCVNKPETHNGYQDADGCPDKLPKKARKFTGNIKGIQFKYNRATIRKRSYKTLKAAGKVLKQFPSLRLKIQGHTDSRGSDSANMELSVKRAEAVKAYLVRKGIEASRLETEGVGSKKPLVKGRGRRARAKNRRIEFHVIIGNK
jgi:OOP family OmpA-OmpF porin